MRASPSAQIPPWNAIRNDKPWQITMSRFHRNCEGLDAAALGRIRNDTLRKYWRRPGCWDWPPSSEAALHRAAVLCRTNKSAARLWQRLSNLKSSTSKPMKLQISQRRSATAKEITTQTVAPLLLSTTLKCTTRVVCKSSTIIYQVSIAQKIELRLFLLLLVGKRALWVRTGSQVSASEPSSNPQPSKSLLHKLPDFGKIFMQ